MQENWDGHIKTFPANECDYESPRRTFRKIIVGGKVPVDGYRSMSIWIRTARRRLGTCTRGDATLEVRRASPMQPPMDGHPDYLNLPPTEGAEELTAHRAATGTRGARTADFDWWSQACRTGYAVLDPTTGV